MFDNKDNQPLPLEIAAADSLVIQCRRNIDRKAKQFRFSGRHIRFSVRPSDLPKISSCSWIIYKKSHHAASFYLYRLTSYSEKVVWVVILFRSIIWVLTCNLYMEACGFCLPIYESSWVLKSVFQTAAKIYFCGPFVTGLRQHQLGTAIEKRACLELIAVT
jgi:hypothetical protein